MPRVCRWVGGHRVTVDGHEVVVFGSNDYLGLACDLETRGDDDGNGLGAGASRLVTGTHSVHVELEQSLAEWLQVESTLLFNSGYNANVGLFAALFGADDVIFSDRLNHASLIDGIRLCKARRVLYPHRDVEALSEQLAANQGARFRVIVSDSLFSMDGDLAPISHLVDLARKMDAVLVLDEAHALGVFGSEGRGAAEHLSCADRVDIRVGTCGKAIGTFGAFVASSQLVCDALYNRARSFVFTTALPPSVVVTTRRHLPLTRREDRRKKLWRNIRAVRSFLADEGIDVSSSVAQIIPLVVGDPDQATALSERLFDAGVWIPAIRPPTVPDGTARLRLALSAAHSEADLDRLFTALRKERSVLA